MSEIDLDALDDATKAVAGAWFGMMRPGKGDLTFNLREGRPSDEAIDALGKLVRAKVISVEAFNRYGGLVYRPLVDCRPAMLWLHRNIGNPAAAVKMTEPLAGGEKQARAIQKRCLAA